MKRAGNLWPKIFDRTLAQQSVRKAVEFKKGNRVVQKLLLYSDADVKKNPSLYHQVDPIKLEKYTDECLEELKNKTWVHKKPALKLQFCRNRSKKKGKWRTLGIPCLKDHCIAHIIMGVAEEVFMKGMHPGCCGSVPGRGIKTVVKKTKYWIKRDKKNCRYFVKLDIKKFFDNITADILKKCIREHFKDPNIIWAIDQIIDSCEFACPVGYYTSPWFGNLLLQKMDWYVEQELHKYRRNKIIKYVKHYVRYMDDILLFGSSKSDLYKAVKVVNKFLIEEYGLHIKTNWEIKELGNKDSHKFGVDICGYKFFKDCTILRDGIFLNASRLARKIYKQGYVKVHQAMSILSKIGWSKMVNCRNFLNNYIKPYVHIKLARRKIGYVAKVENRRFCQTC